MTAEMLFFPPFKARESCHTDDICFHSHVKHGAGRARGQTEADGACHPRALLSNIALVCEQTNEKRADVNGFLHAQ